MPAGARPALALIIVAGLGYPVEAMNVRGERIIVFGDSLTQHTGSVPIWDVDQGPQRNSAGPGDLFASMLLDQGAEAVRLNAKGGRSGYNFWTVEPGAQLIAADVAWKPTKIVFVMGTNDVGMTAGPDLAAYQRIYNGYKASGAEMWVIGPFLNRQDATQREVVYQTLRNVFGANHVIDGRELTKIIAPGADGIHYNTTGARALALNMTDAITSASAVRGWIGIAIGAAVVVGGALIYGLATSPRRGLSGLEIVDGKRWTGSTAELVRSGHRQVPCKSGLDAKGLARCWARGLGSSENPYDTSAASARLTEIQRRKPRPLHKLYRNPTPEQAAAHKIIESRWRSEWNKARKEHAALVEKSNAWIQEQRSKPEGLGLTRDQKDKLVEVVADFGVTARRKKWNNYKDPSESGACDIATQMFIAKAKAAGVPLELHAFDWNNPADLRRMGEIYGIRQKQMRKLQALVATAPDPDCMFHHVAVTDDGFAIDWTANQFRPMPMPFVYKLEAA